MERQTLRQTFFRAKMGIVCFARSVQSSLGSTIDDVLSPDHSLEAQNEARISGRYSTRGEGPRQ